MTTTGRVVYATLYWKDKLRSWHTDQAATKSGPFTESVNAALVAQRRRIFPSHLVTATHTEVRKGQAGQRRVSIQIQNMGCVWKLSPEKQLQEAAVSFQ